MNLYLNNGYANIAAIMNLNLPFNFIVGGRGTGKTYTALKELYNRNIKFMLMRRTQTQLDTISRPDFSPFKSLNRDMGISVGVVQVSKYNGAFYNMIEGEKPGTLIPDGLPIGYTCALSTVANLRGFDASDVEVLLYDEFIPEGHERPIKNEGSAFLNAYETINRNRELYDRNPLQVIALANANDLANPIFLEMGIATVAEKMLRKGQSHSIDKERGIGLFFLTDSPISTRKRKTALYKACGRDFEDMALNNIFVSEDSAPIQSVTLREYRPLVAIGELCVYEHKHNSVYHCCTHISGSPPRFGTGEVETARFARAYSWLWLAYLNRQISFETKLCEKLLTKFLN